jgi:hypothetical protein
MEFDGFNPKAVILGFQLTLLSIAAAAGDIAELAVALAVIGTLIIVVDLFIYVR